MYPVSGKQLGGQNREAATYLAVGIGIGLPQ